MGKFESVKKDVEQRGDFIGPMIKGQMWVELKGQFTVSELRSIAANIERNNKVRSK
jgi:hypothetical protein